MEERLSQHYAILKRFLAQSLRDEKGNPKPNRARDKLLRLSPVQFQELSTDVYDELLRRQSSTGQQRSGPGQVPEYLLPKENFHPKRNQARQKLATLPPLRFQDLATDVFYELERRFPLFAGRAISRVGSPAVSQYGSPPSRVGTPNGFRQNHGPRNTSLGSQVMAGLGIPGVEGPNDHYGRPTAKTSQSNTIIPNKSTMVEDDDDDASEIYGSRRDTALTSRSAGGSEKDRKLAEYETQVGNFENRIGELQGRVQEMELQLRDKNMELDKMYGSQNEQKVVSRSILQLQGSLNIGHLTSQFKTSNTERQKWSRLQSGLEDELIQVRNLNSGLQSELDRARANHDTMERELRSQLDQISSKASGGGEWKARFESLDKEQQDLRTQLLRQEKATSEVRQDASGWLKQMKALSERAGPAFEREERLIHQVHALEKELQEWKSRYATSATQSATLRSSPMANPLQIPKLQGVARNFEHSEGLVQDVHLSKFQIAIDELLRSARENEPDAVLPQVRSVIIAVRCIALDLGDTQSSKDEVMQRTNRSKTKLTATANNLITAAKNFTLAKGLMPVSILDAAASHVAAAVVELTSLVKARRGPTMELDDEDENSLIADSPADYYGIDNSRASAGDASVYSTITSAKPSHSQQPSNLSKPAKSVLNGTSNGTRYSTGVHPPKGAFNMSRERFQELKVRHVSPIMVVLVPINEF